MTRRQNNTPYMNAARMHVQRIYELASAAKEAVRSRDLDPDEAFFLLDQVQSETGKARSHLTRHIYESRRLSGSTPVDSEGEDL